MKDKNGKEIYSKDLVKIWGTYNGVQVKNNGQPVDPHTTTETNFNGETANVARTLDGELCVIIYDGHSYTVDPCDSDKVEIIQRPD